MKDEIMRMLDQVGRLQASLLTLLAKTYESLESPLEAQRSSTPPIKEEATERPTRVDWVWWGDPEFFKAKELAKKLGIDEDYPDAPIPLAGVACKKGGISRAEAWTRVKNVWRILGDTGKIRATPFNALRKFHTKNWYVWVYDPDMAKKKWISARIRERREE